MKRLLRDTLRNNGRLCVESWNLAIRKQYSEYINQAFTYLGGIRKCWGNDSVIVVAVGREEQQDGPLRFYKPMCWNRERTCLGSGGKTGEGRLSDGW